MTVGCGCDGVMWVGWWDVGVTVGCGCDGGMWV